jgi:hypothetical protein
MTKFGIVAVALLLFSLLTAHADTRPSACLQWEVEYWSPTWKMSPPLSTADEEKANHAWTVPEGWEPFAKDPGRTPGWELRRCVR